MLRWERQNHGGVGKLSLESLRAIFFCLEGRGGKRGKDLGRGSFEYLMGVFGDPGNGLEARDCAYSKGKCKKTSFWKYQSIDEGLHKIIRSLGIIIKPLRANNC